jgi:hypothetical protein
MKKELVVEWQHKFNTITKQSKKNRHGFGIRTSFSFTPLENRIKWTRNF